MTTEPMSKTRARDDLIQKMQGLLREIDLAAAVDRLQAAGADPIGEHIKGLQDHHLGTWTVPKCLLCAVLTDFIAARGIGPNRRRYLQSTQDRQWIKRIANYERLL